MGFQYVAAVAGAASVMSENPSLAQTSLTALTTTSISSFTSSTSPTLISTTSRRSTSPVESLTSTSTSSITESPISSSSISSTTSASTTLTTSSSTSISVPVPAATASPSLTPALDPIPALSTRSPPFYIGIILAGILLIAVGAAIVAWCLRSRRYGRKGFWKHDLEDWTPTIPTSDAEKTNIWEPTGDRDAGEPKRGLDEEIGAVPPVLRESIAFPLPVAPPYAYVSPTPIPMSPYAVPPPMVVDSFPSDQSSSLSSFQSSLSMPSVTGQTPYNSQSALIPNEFGTPRTTQDRPRFLCLSSGKGLAVPWRTKEEDSATRARDGEFVNMEEQHRYLAPPPVPSPPEQRYLDIPATTTGGWTNSLRANIMGALSGLKSPAQIFLPSQAPDRLTPEPVMRRSMRRSKDGAARAHSDSISLRREPESGGSTVLGDVDSDMKSVDSLEDDKSVDGALDSGETTRVNSVSEDKGSGVERKPSVVSVYTPEEEVARKALVARISKIEGVV